MKTITLMNQKGGVGKTSTCHHLAGAFAALGHSVLLIDNDPQASLSQGFFGPEAVRRMDPEDTIAAVYRGRRPSPRAIVHPTGHPRIEIAPGSRAVGSHNLPDPERLPVTDQHALASFVEACADEGAWDVALIDCPPNLCLCSWAALLASDGLVIPLQPEDYGAQGLEPVLDAVEAVRGGPNPRLRNLGMLLQRVGRKSIHALYEGNLRALYTSTVFEAKIPDAVGYIEAIAYRKPIELYRPKSAAAAAIRALAREIGSRAAIPAPLLEPAGA